MIKIMVQEYIVHLSNGLSVIVNEDFDTPFEEGLIRKYEEAEDNKLFTFGNGMDGFTYVLKKNITCIMTGDVAEGVKWSGSKD